MKLGAAKPKTTDDNTCIVSRHFPFAPEKVFDAWFDPKIRAMVLQRTTYKYCIKEVNPVEGGIERYEQRWKNTLYGKSVRTYASITRPSEVVTEICNPPTKRTIAGFLPPAAVFVREHLTFGKTDQGTMLKISEVYPSMWRSKLASFARRESADRWNLDLDVFENALLNL